MKISLARFNNTGAAACIEDSDGDDFVILCGNTYTSRQACKKAAERLRTAAMRFETLAEMKDPFHEKSHNAVNRI